jgi:putative transposase
MQQIQRKSYNTTNKIYFFTATIHKWLPLLADDNNQQLITEYLKKLCDEGLITVFAFVLMPNHVHFIWQQNKLNGRETPQGSFLKYTAHEFLKKLKINGKSKMYEVNAANKKHELWQRDSLSVEIYSREVAMQKLQYIHFNPLASLRVATQCSPQFPNTTFSMLNKYFTPFPTLTTQRLTLRQLIINDEQEIFTLRSYSAINKYLGRPLSTTIEDAKDFTHKVNKNLHNNIS